MIASLVYCIHFWKNSNLEIEIFLEVGTLLLLIRICRLYIRIDRLID